MDDLIAPLIGRCYEAIVAPETWSFALDDLSTALGAAGACLNPSGVSAERRMNAPASSRYRAMFADFVGQGWASEDMRARRGWPLVKSGQMIVYEDDVTSAEERRRMPIYNELFAPHGMEMFAGLGLSAGGRTWSLSLTRAAAAGRFDTPDENARLSRLRPALERMLLYAEHLSTAAVTGALAAFEQASIAAVFIDADGKPRLFNARADAMLGRDLHVVSRRLTFKGDAAEGHAGNAALTALIDTMLRRDAAASSAGGQIALRRPGRTPLIVDAVPVGRMVADAFGRAGCLLLITDLESAAPAGQRLLGAAFNLTQREAEVAGFLRAGRAAPAIATALGMRLTSVQQVIKTILVKTGVGRQGELVALLGRFPVNRSA